jgi:hypothetical protein
LTLFGQNGHFGPKIALYTLGLLGPENDQKKGVKNPFQKWTRFLTTFDKTQTFGVKNRSRGFALSAPEKWVIFDPFFDGS